MASAHLLDRAAQQHHRVRAGQPGLRRERATERRLAIDAALNVWLTAGKQEPLKAHIAAVALTDAEMQAAYAEWMQPRVKSADEIWCEEEQAEAMRVNDSARSEREQS